MDNIRFKSHILLFFLLFALIVLIPKLTLAQAPAQATAINGADSRIYKSIDGYELYLHIFRPGPSAAESNSPLKPAIVFFFGGGWVQGSVTQFTPHAQHLAARGMVAVVADYRVQNRHGSNPLASVEDAKSAVRWLRTNAIELGIDPNRIAAGGGSAGGHIAATTAVLLDFDHADEDLDISSSPNALVLFNPAVNTGDLGENLNQRFNGKGVAASPFHQLQRGLPPTIIVHGKADSTVPYEHAEQFCAKAINFGDQCLLFGYDEAEHGFFNKGREDDRWYKLTLMEVDRFLTQLGYIPGPVPDQID